MERLREWGFPIALIVAWMVATAYTVSLLIGPADQGAASVPETPGVAESHLPAS